MMSQLKKKWIVLIGLSAWLVQFQQVALGSHGSEASPPLHCRVIWTSNPATSAMISWSTTQATADSTVHYRVRNSDQAALSAIPSAGRFTGKEIELYYCHAHLTELKPATEYEFWIRNGDQQSKKLYFATAPSEDRPFSIIQGGDSRSDHKTRRQVNKMMANRVAKSYSNDDLADDIIAFAHGGDYVANGANLQQWQAWLADHELTINDDGRVLPIIPARGNHDKSELFNQVFGFPEKDRNYYAINLGPAIRLVTLNTETSTAGNQAKWLTRELKSSRPVNRWVLAQYHRPAYPAVKAPGTALQSWVPIFERFNVDLVCEADGHSIKRTVPIRGNVKDESGVVYVGEGGLGVGQRTPKSTRWYLQSPGMSDSASHFFVLTFESEQLLGRCIRLDGSIADQFVRKPRTEN